MDSQTNYSKSREYTILRIKRKRNEEPLDALVVESRTRRKKSRGGPGVFQYAQTVERDAWKDEQQQKKLRDQISRLANERPLSSEAHASVPPSPSQRRISKDDTCRRYKIIEQGSTELEDVQEKPPGFDEAHHPIPSNNGIACLKMFSAVLSTDDLSDSEVDPEIEKFLPLLNDYLRINDIKPSRPPMSVLKPEVPSDPDLEFSDYVWDVFYHRPINLAGWNQATNIGTLTGLPSMIVDSDDSTSEPEGGDSEDEDSNAEEYYKNDYPDEEDPSSDEEGSSDEFHEHSEYDDMNYSDNDMAL